MIKSFKQFINESVDYKQIIDKLISDVLDEVNDYLKDLELSVVFDDEYDYTDFEGVAVYENGSVIEYDGQMEIGINKDLFIQVCQENEFTTGETEDQVRVSIWHEVGHGLVEYLFEQWDTYRQSYELSGDENHMVDEWHKKYESYIDNDDEEEDIVEEFGNYMSGIEFSSILYDMVNDFKDIQW